MVGHALLEFRAPVPGPKCFLKRTTVFFLHSRNLTSQYLILAYMYNGDKV